MHHPHEPAALRLVIRRAPTGGLLVTTPITPGWCAHAACPAELAQVIERAWVEATVAAYARLRGVLYDLAETEECIPPEAYPASDRPHPAETPTEAERVERRRRTKHPRTHPPERWAELSDGALLSPTGRRYGPATRVASAVRARKEQP
jgi:hypothetical protein